MANLSTIAGNIFADSGIDPINVVLNTGSYSNPSWITALPWTKISDRPTTLAGYGISDAVPSSRTLTINGTSYDLSANRSWTIAAGVSSIIAGTGISVSGSGDITITNTGVLSINGSTGAITGIITTSNYNSYSPTLTGGGASGTWGINVTGTAGSISGFNNPTTAATPNTIAYRDSLGDLSARYFMGAYINTVDDTTTTGMTYIMAKFGDNYHRSASAAKVQVFLGLGSMAYQAASSYALLNGNTGQNFSVNSVVYASTTFNPAAGPRNTEPMSIKMWNNYFNGTGLGSDYGTVLQYYSLSGHVDSQVYFDASGGSWFRTASYAASYGAWQRYVTENSGTWGISITGNSATATAAQNATFLTQPNATWGARMQLGGNGAGSGVANIAVLQATDGNIHMDNGVGKSTYLNYYHNGIIYLNGGTYYISANGSQYNGNAASSTTATQLSGYAQQVVYTILDGPANGPVIKVRYDGGTANRYIDIGSKDGNGVYYEGFKIYNGDTPTWKGNTILHAGNYNSYTPTLTGGGASGTWGINITGNASKLDPLSGDSSYKLAYTADGARTNAGEWGRAVMYYVPNGQTYGIRVDRADNADTVGGFNANAFYRNIGFEGGGSNADTLAESRSAFTYANNAPYSGPILYVGASGYGLQLNATYQSGNDIAFRTRNGDAGTFNPWRTIVHSGNIASQFVTGLNSSNSISQRGSNGSWNADFQATPAGSLSYGGDLGANTVNGPGGSWWMQQNFRHTNSSSFWGVQVAWGWEDNQSKLATRNISGGIYGGWVYYMNNSNSTYAYNMNQYVRTSDSPTFANLYLNSTLSLPGTINFTNGGGPTYILEGYGIRLYGGGIQPVQAANCSLLVGTVAAGGNYGSGNIYATGDVTAYYSDGRLKHNLNRIDNALSKVLSLNGYTYQHNILGQKLLGENPNKIHSGLIAQEVQKVLSEVVTIAPFDLNGFDDNGNGISKSGENYLTIKYERLVPLLIEAIKEQQIQIEELKKSIN